MPNDNVLTDIARRDIEHALRWIQPANPAHRILTTLLDLHPDRPERAKCSDGGACGAGGYCDACPQRQSEPRAEVTEEQPSLTNPLTPYGILVRALRIVAGITLMDMANSLLTTPAKLSAMEFGRAPVTPEFAFDVAAYFDALGVPYTASALRAAAARTGASS